MLAVVLRGVDWLGEGEHTFWRECVGEVVVDCSFWGSLN